MAEDTEHVQAHYHEVQDLQTAEVYVGARRHPERTLVDCGCGRTLITDGFTASCTQCGSDHTVAFRSDEAIHP